MSIRARHRIEFGFAGTAAVILLVLLRVNLAAERVSTDTIHCYGGRLSEADRSALESLNDDLRNASDVESIEAQGIRILSRSGKLKEYRLIRGALRRDGEPVLKGIRSFHFEFRDGGGGLLTLRRQNCGYVRSVGYTLRMKIRRSEVTVQSGSEMPFHAPHQVSALPETTARD
jgi:hypothetical protein